MKRNDKIKAGGRNVSQPSRWPFPDRKEFLSHSDRVFVHFIHTFSKSPFGEDLYPLNTTWGVFCFALCFLYKGGKMRRRGHRAANWGLPIGLSAAAATRTRKAKCKRLPRPPGQPRSPATYTSDTEISSVLMYPVPLGPSTSMGSAAGRSTGDTPLAGPHAQACPGEGSAPGSGRAVSLSEARNPAGAVPGAAARPGCRNHTAGQNNCGH